MQEVFDNMKVLMLVNEITAYLDHNQQFVIYIEDASDCQLGAVLMQGGRPVACYSQKLNSAQRNYTTVQK